MDQERLEEESPEVRGSGSLFMDIYAQLARDYMSDHEARPEDFAALVVKNRRHASHNPVAQFTAPITVEEVLEARLINDPLTLPMCSPIGNGAAALVLTVEPAREATAVRLLASSLVSGQGRHSEPAVAHAARLAFDQSGVSPGRREPRRGARRHRACRSSSRWRSWACLAPGRASSRCGRDG